MKIFWRINILLAVLFCFTLGFGINAVYGNDGPVIAEIRDFNGAPTMFINGEPNAGMAYMTYKMLPDMYRDFGKIGVDLASFSTTADYKFYDKHPVVFLGPGKYDFSEIDKGFDLILEANPDVYIFPRIYLASPPWWNEKYPDETGLYRTNDVDDLTKGVRQTPSWASEKWRGDTAENLRHFVSHVREKYGKNVIGYHIASGMTEEWFYWESFTEKFLDYSAPQLHAFRVWLRKKYGSDSELRNAWNDPDITIDTAVIPPKSERKRADFFSFRDPQKSRNVIDYYLFHSDVVAETITYLASAVKEACNRESLVGVFYGYIFEMNGITQYSGQNGGHLAMMKLLNCDDIDMLVLPSSYDFRHLGKGASVYMSTIGSVRLHGKLWMDENDYRTHKLKPVWGLGGRYLGMGNTVEEDFQIQTRQVAHEICNASGAWWFDMGGGWYDDPALMTAIEKLNSIAENSVNYDRGSSAEIAVVVDERSIPSLSIDMNLTSPLLTLQRKPLAMLGAPVDYIYLEDIAAARSYKMYLLLNVFSPDENALRAIDDLSRRGTESIVWFYAPNFSGDTLDVKQCRDAIGMRLGMIGQAAPLEVEISDEGAQFLPGLDSGDLYGTENEIGPVFIGDDPAAVILGRLRSVDEPGLITKMVDGVQMYYSAAPLMSAKVLRAIAQKSGVHVYNYRDDVLYANKRFLSLHTHDKEGGNRNVRLPSKTDVYDVMGDMVIAENATSFTVDIPENQTKLYFLGSESEWLKTYRR